MTLGGVLGDRQHAILCLARNLLFVASERGFLSAPFQHAQTVFFEALTTISGYAEWHSWWVLSDEGAHWFLLFDVGPRTARHNFLSTTNASESQHRVVKHDFTLVNVPGDALKEPMRSRSLDLGWAAGDSPCRRGTRRKASSRRM